MSDPSRLYQQADPVNVPVRPLSRGMMSNVSEVAIPRGAFLKAENVIIREKGAYRRPPWIRNSTVAVPYPPLREVIQLWKIDGTQQAVAIDSKFLYQWDIEAGTFTGKYLTYVTGTCSTSGVTVTGAGGAAWVTGDIRSGDVIILDANGSGSGPTAATILSVGGETTLTLTATPAGTYGAGTDYEIRKAMNPQAPNMLDWAIADNKIIIVDGERVPFSYDGTTFGVYHASITIIPRCVAYFLDRVWFGGYISGSNDYRQYMQWTLTTNRQTMSGYSLGLPYVQGRLVRLVPLGPNIIAYFDDSIWMGRRTGIQGNALPAAFTRIDTKGTGLLGPRGLVAMDDAHLAACDDDIYPVTNRGLEVPVGTPVFAKMIEGLAYPWLIRAAIDIVNDRIVFGMPGSSEQIERIWSFCTKGGMWSYDAVPCEMLETSPAAETLTWDTYGTAPYTTGTVSGASPGTTVEGAGGMAWAANVSAGDHIFVDTDGDGVYETYYTVASVTDNDTLVTVEAISPAFSAKPYYIVEHESSWDEIPYATWSTFGSEVSGIKRLYFGKDGYICSFESDQTLDNALTGVVAVLETGDDDLEAPDNNKTWLRFGIRIDRELSGDLGVSVRFSTNQGDTWRVLGVRTIEAGKRGTFINFKATGAQIRFEVTLTGSVESFYVTEFTYRVAGRGVEVAVD